MPDGQRMSARFHRRARVTPGASVPTHVGSRLSKKPPADGIL